MKWGAPLYCCDEEVLWSKTLYSGLYAIECLYQYQGSVTRVTAPKSLWAWLPQYSFKSLQKSLRPRPRVHTMTHHEIEYLMVGHGAVTLAWGRGAGMGI